MSDVRDRFTSSDAETGPLDDISTTGPALVDTFADGMTDEALTAERASEVIADAAKPRPDADYDLGAALANTSALQGGGGGGTHIDMGEIHIDASGASDPAAVGEAARDGLASALRSKNVTR